MSLLMKALANAEKEKSGKARPEKPQKTAADNIAPFPSVHHGKPQTLQPTPQPQQQAANIFSAARLPESRFTQTLWGLGFVSLALLIWLGLQFFPDHAGSTQLLVAENNLRPTTPMPSNALPPAPVALAVAATQTNSPPLSQTQKSLFAPASPQKNIPIETASPAEPLLSRVDELVADKKIAAPLPSSDLQLTHKKTGPAVEPVLLSAYQAFQQNDFSQAQQLYRQVLKNDVRNVDALLGMAAIAQKQGRNLDAMGWYQKVLALDPTHAMALAATVELQPTTDNDSQLAYLKNLIAQQPENAHFYASLGNLYAEQNRWQEAQSAYFETVRLSPQTAEYAFNLAVSLEHLNQPQLALMQYQRSLQLIEQTGATSPDRTSIKNRILALQPTP